MSSVNQFPRVLGQCLLWASVGFCGAVAAQEDGAASGLDGETQLYGRIDLSVDNVKAGINSNVGYGTPGARVSRMVDNTSRLGVRGSENLGGGLGAIYGAELGINADEGSLVSPNFRYSFVGLRGNWGTVNLGRLDSSVPTGSPLYSQLAKNLRWIIHDAGATAIGTRILNGNNRVSNAIAYKSPDISGFNVAARVNLAGPDTGVTSTNANLKGEADFKQYQVALNFAQGPLGAGLGYAADSKKGGFLANDFKGKMQAVVTYDFSAVRPYVAMGRERYNNTATSRDVVNFWLVGATAPVPSGRVTANVMGRSVQTDRSGSLRKFQAEYSYFLSKRSTLYVYVDRDTSNSNKADSVASTLGLGIMHQF